MLLGTVIGVLVIPGLYYLFARLAGDNKLLQDETDEPLSETVEHKLPLDEIALSADGDLSHTQPAPASEQIDAEVLAEDAH
jgi:hypothetical protein